MSLYVGVSYPQQLGGIVALSGYLPYTGDVSKVRAATIVNGCNRGHLAIAIMGF